ncbi:MAG: Fic family protein [Proteobacteria bacterium]|nr:Fic family protein [Pseudomonadota bacterium]
MRKAGEYQKLGDMNYFIPFSLPPIDPPLHLNAAMLELCMEASFALGQLNEISIQLPDYKRFVRGYVIREAMLSSAIEGIHTTLAEVFTASLTGSKASKSTQLVNNYSQAIDTALEMTQQQGLPVATRVILKAHEVLMSAGDGDKSAPGQFRQQTVRVGELVPPPAPRVAGLIGDLERYINDVHDIPPLIKAGLAHVQFETIHPFLDGNGRIGRMLIVLMLINSGLLTLPTIYPSHYFKKHHLEYYQRLDRVRSHGDFEGWITYYLAAIKESAQEAYKRGRDITRLYNQLNHFVQTADDFSKMRITAMDVVDALFAQPITTITEISKATEKAYNTVHKTLQCLKSHNLVAEMPINERHKLYHFTPYLKILQIE